MSIFKSWTIAGKVETWIRAEIIKSNAFVNNIKTIEQSAPVQTAETILVTLLTTIFPAAHIPEIVIKIKNYFNAVSTLAGNVATEANKSDDEIAKDALLALLKLKLLNPNAYAVQMHALNSFVNTEASAINGNPISIEDSLSNVQLVYNLEKASANITEPAVEVKQAPSTATTSI